ncbi:conserved hypothetical protein [Streptomyces sp. C]|nr:conserved hypothetical protein [Streptomyces sp. C]
MKRLTTLLATALVATAGILDTSTTAEAADCRSGYFCVWTHAHFDGMKIEHSGDDSWWEGDMFKQDSSWANHGVERPGRAGPREGVRGPQAPGPGDALSGPRPGGRLQRRRQRPGRLPHLVDGLLRPPG